MVKLQLSLLGAALLASCVVLGDHPPPPRPRYPEHPPPPSHPSYPYPPLQSYYEEVCKLKEWSSDTELCKPGMALQCEQEEVNVKKIVQGEPRCIKFKVPKCKTNDEAEEMDLCSITVENKLLNLEAELFEADMKQRCDTHYITECKPSYNYKPKCETVPTHNCYDVPILKPIKVPIRVKGNEINSGCSKQAIPTPKTICWDEEVEHCSSYPELEDQKEHISKCAPGVSEDECERVRLTIPREICFHVQKFRPVYQQQHPFVAKQ